MHRLIGLIVEVQHVILTNGKEVQAFGGEDIALLLCRRY